jgi:Protein of unknown function (DUF3309)
MSIGLILVIILIIVLLGGVSGRYRGYGYGYGHGGIGLSHVLIVLICAPSSGSDPLTQDKCLGWNALLALHCQMTLARAHANEMPLI